MGSAGLAGNRPVHRAGSRKGPPVGVVQSAKPNITAEPNGSRPPSPITDRYSSISDLIERALSGARGETTWPGPAARSGERAAPAVRSGHRRGRIALPVIRSSAGVSISYPSIVKLMERGAAFYDTRFNAPRKLPTSWTGPRRTSHLPKVPTHTCAYTHIYRG